MTANLQSEQLNSAEMRISVYIRYLYIRMCVVCYVCVCFVVDSHRSVHLWLDIMYVYYVHVLLCMAYDAHGSD